MPNSWRVMVCACLTLAATHLPGQAQPAVRPVTPDSLVSVLAKEQSSIAAADISVPAGVVARGDAPEFTVLSIERAVGANARYWVRIACRNTAQCLPFYASVASSTPLTCGPRQLAAAHIVHADPPVMHVGDRATLVIHRDRSLIQLAVVALQSGSIGQDIRLATPDYKQFFHGQVVNAKQLQGEL